MSHIKDPCERRLLKIAPSYARNRNVVVAGSQCLVCVPDGKDEWLLCLGLDGWRCLLLLAFLFACQTVDVNGVLGAMCERGSNLEGPGNFTH
ncbi:hypothetical protein CDAR_266381 [Caerostris darwini]|uniref:Uncharacterized protein n=1 Tax=Caerostris darwini TaxID=1538125 RepID=A0AAV4Q4J0_9ARAC|nr:hypothetical protein CDAR_266381 [Caerostris darwini]